MNNKQNARRAGIVSVLTITLCCAEAVGSYLSGVDMGAFAHMDFPMIVVAVFYYPDWQ